MLLFIYFIKLNKNYVARIKILNLDSYVESPHFPTKIQGNASKKKPPSYQPTPIILQKSQPHGITSLSTTQPHLKSL
jgi:hypothetical protein